MSWNCGGIILGVKGSKGNRKGRGVLYIQYNVSTVSLFVSCQLSAFPISVEVPVDVEISVVVDKSAVVSYWTILHGMPRGDFSTMWAAILHTIPLDVVGTVALKTTNRSRRGGRSGGRSLV